MGGNVGGWCLRWNSDPNPDPPAPIPNPAIISSSSNSCGRGRNVALDDLGSAVPGVMPIAPLSVFK